MGIQIAIPRDEIAAFCQRHPIRRLLLFGSALGEDFGPDSDVDLLIEFEPEAGIGFFTFIEIEDALSAILGRRVDLSTPESLSRHFRGKVIQSAEAVYEREG